VHRDAPESPAAARFIAKAFYVNSMKVAGFRLASPGRPVCRPTNGMTFAAPDRTIVRQISASRMNT